MLMSSTSQKSIHILSVEVGLYQNSGANMVQQLAYGLAHANEYLNWYDVNSFENVVFKVAIGSNYFFEIAKLRALRLLWKTIAAAYGIKSNCHIMATPSRRNKTVYDYNVNLVRSTSECMSAILGGADTICNLPYDSLYRKDNEFSERIARNQLLILKKESYFENTENPVDGTYYMATLTQQLAEKALVLFKEIEASGGFLTQLLNNTIQKKIKESAQKEQKRFTENDEILVGTNAFKNTDERMKEQLQLYPFVKTKSRKTLIEPIIPRRLAEEVEQSRLKNEK
jgi:methylmalonyl-CoA mutase